MTKELKAHDPSEFRLEDQIGFKLRRANQRYLTLFSQHMAELTPTQLAVLFKLREKGHLSQNYLGRLVAIDAASTKTVVDRLRVKALIVSAPSQTDRRMLVIALTETGRHAADRGAEQARILAHEAFSHLTTREAAKLSALLDKFCASP